MTINLLFSARISCSNFNVISLGLVELRHPEYNYYLESVRLCDKF